MYNAFFDEHEESFEGVGGQLHVSPWRQRVMAELVELQRLFSEGWQDDPLSLGRMT
jgi:hypothetical protein